MPPIDYTIPGQFQRVQLEPPENAMARVMQMRGLQETSQMNALKMQEYQQDVTEKNALAQIYANPNLKYGSPEFFSAVAQRAPRYFEKIATGEQQRQLALSTQATREQQRQEAEQKQRLAKREFGLRKIASASDYGQAASLIERGIRTGEIDREEGDDMLSRLNPDTDIRQFRSDVITNLLPAEKALTAASDIEKAGLGVSAEKQKLENEKLDFETKQLDARRKQFDLMYPPNLIQSAEDVKNRILLQAQDPALKQLLTRFGTLEEIIARDVDEFGRDPLGYKTRLSGVPTANILKAAEEKDKEAYFAHVRQAIEDETEPMSEEAFMASRRKISSAAVSAQSSATETPVSDVTAPRLQEVPAFDRNAPRPVIDATAAVAPNAAVSSEAAMALAPAAAKRQAEYTIHPKAQAFYDLFALSKNQADKAMGDAIQNAHIKQQERSITDVPTSVQELKAYLAMSPAEKAAYEKLQKIKTLNVSASATSSAAGKSLAGPIGDRANASLVKAEGAAGIMESANMVREALNTNKVIAGVGAGVRMKFAQVLDLAGAGDKEKLVNTRQAIQGLATMTLESRAELKGQGQVTENEQKLLERARSGNIEDMTVAELQQVVNVAQRLATRLWSNHQTMLKTMETDPAAKDVIRYYYPTGTLPSAVGQSSSQGQTDNRTKGLDKIFGGKK